jgi:hypothetical protein
VTKRPAPKKPKESPWGGRLPSLVPQWYEPTQWLRQARRAGWHKKHPEEFLDLRAATLELRVAIQMMDREWIRDAHHHCVLALYDLREAAQRPLAKHGAIMKAGRKPGAVGAIRKRLRALLARDPACENLEAWELLKLRPPKGWTFVDRSAERAKWFIDHPGGSTGWPRFCNLLAEERKRIKK